MEFLMELLFELIFEGWFELSKSKKITKWIRYPLISLILLGFILVFLLIVLVGVLIWKENICFSLLMFGISIIFLCTGIKEFKKIYFKKKNIDKDNIGE